MKGTHKNKWIAGVAAFLVMTAFTAHAQAATVFVSTAPANDPTAVMGTSDNPFTSIQAAIDDSNTNVGDTVSVDGSSGSYTGNVTLDKSVTLTTSNNASISGEIIVTAANSAVNGFTLSNVNGDTGIDVKAVDNVTVSNNNISNVGVLSDTNNANGIYIENGATNVTARGNTISNIASHPSAHGIMVGDSSSSTTATDSITLSNNTISFVSSEIKGGYGILINHVASHVSITGNIINNISSGGWTHAISLDFDTPNASISNNTITALSTTGTGDVAGIHFENDASLATTVSLSGNTVDGGTVATDTSKVAVNAAWATGVVAGSSVTGPDGASYTYGYNAFATLQAAVTAVSTNGTIVLGSDLTTTAQITISKGLTLNGGGFTIHPNFTKTDSTNNAAIGILNVTDAVTISDLKEDGTSGTNLHGINLFEAGNATFNNVSVANNQHTGISVNGSTLTVTNVSTSNDGWGGIDIDKPADATSATVLTINGTSTHSETTVDIIKDDNTRDVTLVDSNHQYTSKDVTNAGVTGTAYTLAPIVVTPVGSGGGSVSGGGSAGGGGAAVSTAVTTPAATTTTTTTTTAPTGQVLGAETFNFTAALASGAHGDEVMQLQTRLVADGFIVSKDGKFGPKTKAALMKWQKAHGLKADGVVGPKTRAALNAQ